MSRLFFSGFLIFSLLFFSNAYAEVAIESLSEGEVTGALEDFSALMEHTTASPASSLGDIFGFEVGLAGGISTVPTIEKVMKREDASEAESKLPHLGIVGVVSIPLGFSFETKIFPHTHDSASGVTLSSESLAVKWTATKIITLPFELAARWQVTTSDIKVKDEVDVSGSDVDVTIKYGTVSTSGLVLASYKFLVVEPFVGLGFTYMDGEISVHGDPDATIFDSQSQRSGATSTGAIFLAGAQVTLLFFKAAVEYSHIFDADKFTAKLALGF